MANEILLKPMTAEMYHEFFREYQNDLDLYLNKDEFFEYVYDESKVDACNIVKRVDTIFREKYLRTVA